MVCNLDFVESIFGNAENPDLAENDAALDPEHWTGTTGMVILAPQLIKLKNGIASDVAKQITGFIRDGKFKVTTQIQGDEVRVNSKSRDELQAIIAAVRAQDFPVPVQFVNFRD